MDAAAKVEPASALAAARTLATALVVGIALGVVARLWMRLISEEPEFTWGGSLFIVIGFAWFSCTQAVVVVTRRRSASRGRRAVARLIGVVGLLPLFIAAGALMAPTVIGGGFAAGQVTWPRRVRVICLAIALLPVAFIASDLIDSFGWSLRTAAGLLGLLTLYGVIVTMARPTFSLPPGVRPLPRWARWIVAGAGGLVLIVALGVGGIG